MRLGLVAAIGEGREGARQLQQRNLRGAERQRGVVDELRGDAHALGGLDHLRRADFGGQLRRDGVERGGERVGDRHLAAELVVVVRRRPIADLRRLVVDDRLRPPALFERGRIDEGFEGRARLALGVDGPVELALVVVPPADDGADRAGAVESDECALRNILRRAVDRLADDRLGLFLQPEVDRRLDDDVLGDVRRQIGQIAHHHVGGIVLAASPVGAGGRRFLGLRRRQLLGRDEVLRGHCLEDDEGAGLGAFGVAHRRETRGRLEQPGERGGFRKRDLAGVLVEIAPRRRLHAGRARAEIDPVQIHLQDLVLGELRLQPERQHRFLDLALDRLVGCQKDVLGELLG